VARVLEERGWRRLPFDLSFTCEFDLKWVEQRGRIDYARHIPGQFVNHIPNNDVITSKVKFVETMRAHEVATGETFPWAPRTFLSENGADRLAALDVVADLWVFKPSRGLGGTGIEIITSEDLRTRLFPDGPSGVAVPREGWVVQQYVDKPLLVKGRKFDVRAYCLVARTEPFLWFFHPGYCKVSLEPYEGAALDNRFAHLTNACVQKTHPDYKEHRGEHIWSLADVEAEVGVKIWESAHEELKKALGTIYAASRDKLARKQGYFDLLGLDFMLDSDHKLHFLEVNSNPAMWTDSSPVLQELVPRLLATSLDTVLAAQKPGAGHVDAPAPFELIVDEATGYRYGDASSC
jgi:hypothetical protein